MAVTKKKKTLRLAKTKTKKTRRLTKTKTKKSKKDKKKKGLKKQQTKEEQPPGTENPFKLVMYHLVRIPWYIVKTFDWMFTLFTALLVYLSK